MSILADYNNTPILAYYNNTFVIEIYGSDIDVGAVLMQESHPISYLSKALCQKTKL